MKILQLCNRIPYPARDGGAIAMYNMTRGLRNAGCDVYLFALNTHKHYINPEEVPESLIPQDRFTAVHADTRVKPLNAFFNLFTSQSYNIIRFEHKHVANKLKQVLAENDFDVVQVEGLFMAPYLPVIRENFDKPVVLRAHNVEYRIWERMAESAIPGPKKWYLKLLTNRLKVYETTMLPRFDAVAAITQTDADLISRYTDNIPVFTLPAGVDINDDQILEYQPVKKSAFHLGALDWMPNIEGINWFLKSVWPKVLEKEADAKFHIAGRHIPKAVYNQASDSVIVHGEIENAQSFMNEKGIMVVPLLSGSGMRVKIIEGMAAGKMIVSTTVGAEGIECKDGKHFLLADTAENFAEKILACMTDEALCRSLSENAFRLAAEKYSNKAVAGDLITFYKKLLSA